MSEMRCVIIRDDDTNALTPVDCLERLYRPFLERGLPVNLAVIPEVTTAAVTQDGQPEGFLYGIGEPTTGSSQTLPVGRNKKLVRYLLDNPGFHVLQHGCHHEFLEFDRLPAAEIGERLELGRRRLREAGFSEPETFVAPYDKVSRAALARIANRFRVFSTGWFELRRLPFAWWPKYAVKRCREVPHWRVGRTDLLSHPGCLLSCHHGYSTMFDRIREAVHRQRVTVLVTHWWEYFRRGSADDSLIDILHQTAEYLASDPAIKVVSFANLPRELN